MFSVVWYAWTRSVDLLNVTILESIESVICKSVYSGLIGIDIFKEQVDIWIGHLQMSYGYHHIVFRFILISSALYEDVSGNYSNGKADNNTTPTL